MGNQISSTGAVPPFSAAGTILGYVSFIITLGTFVRVFWSNLRTLSTADSEVSSLLPGLKQALIEERNHLRTVRRRCRGQYDEGAFSVLHNAVRGMIVQFKDLERPFREDGGAVEAGGNGAGSTRAGRRARRLSAREKERRLESGDREEGLEDDYYMMDYGARSLGLRVRWLYRRSKVVALSERLTKVQTRRMARQTCDIAVDVRFIARTLGEMQDRQHGMDGGGGQPQQRTPRNGRRVSMMG